MAMSNDDSHPLVKLLWNGFSARALVHTAVWPPTWPAAGCFGKCKSSILSPFSQGNWGHWPSAMGVPIVEWRAYLTNRYVSVRIAMRIAAITHELNGTLGSRLAIEISFQSRVTRARR